MRTRAISTHSLIEQKTEDVQNDHRDAVSSRWEQIDRDPNMLLEDKYDAWNKQIDKALGENDIKLADDLKLRMTNYQATRTMHPAETSPQGWVFYAGKDSPAFQTMPIHVLHEGLGRACDGHEGDHVGVTRERVHIKCLPLGRSRGAG